ncbi:hypothetical protein TIFTF001_025728 [Ficus carica]|uniref:Uncharacterized protein n=1 Tax=Ficus carica TaxID=3494 RepID=A0AA88DHD2_FICCA|nr:hypothetical protein TIFTF001_025728 [Ficus carica]
MAALARISRTALTSCAASAQQSLFQRALSTEAAKAIRPSEDRVKWDYRGQRKIIPLGQWLPKVAVDAYVAPNVVLAGQVTICDGASVWAGSVLRGDLNKITVGFCSNVQERCVIHAAWSSPTGLPAETSIERFVTIGAYSLLRSCVIEPECIIGQHSILMEGSLVETHSILEAGSVLPPGRRIPTGELWAGNPARFVRALTHEETLEIPKLAVAINDLSKEHFSEFLPYATVYLESTITNRDQWHGGKLILIPIAAATENSTLLPLHGGANPTSACRWCDLLFPLLHCPLILPAAFQTHLHPPSVQATPSSLTNLEDNVPESGGVTTRKRTEPFKQNDGELDWMRENRTISYKRIPY